ncbi:MAG TPA: TlpA disulfide reductase family protein [Planctomycetaceae bacterium]|nr:TlpA disulfide reductase family protein [Planctomycetaceae bacterium]
MQIMICQSFTALSAAEDAPAASFAQLRNGQIQTDFRSVSTWLTENPDAPDFIDAAIWYLQTAYENGWYADTSAIAKKIIADQSGGPEAQKLAHRLSVLAQAARQEETAFADFQTQLRRVSIRDPNETLEFAFALCAQYQVNGDIDAAREVLQLTSESFFLNMQVRTLCDRRLAKLLLVGKTAPALSWKTVTGESASLTDLQGQTVLIDFWATNCAPCLADLPHLKQVYSRFHPRKFEIVGLSLDQSSKDVLAFRESRHLTWPLALVTDSPADTREKFRVVTIPSTFLVDREGKIVLVDGTARDIALMLEKLAEPAE